MPKVPSVPDRQHPRPIRVRVLGHAGTAARTVHDYAHGCMLMRLMQTSVSAVPGTTDPGVLPRDAAGRIPVAIIGAAGYVGAELIRLLERHPDVRIVGLAARGRDGLPVGAAFAPRGETGHRIDRARPAAPRAAWGGGGGGGGGRGGGGGGGGPQGGGPGGGAGSRSWRSTSPRR